ncbi:unnamed protein product [Rotaria socialis]
MDNDDENMLCLSVNSTVQSYPAAQTSEDDENYDSDRIVDNSSSRLCSLQSEASGEQRKRLKGGGHKIKYADLDDPSTIRHEKITFKKLFRQGANLSTELKHEAPSIKWYRRFMIRHRLSLQRPKRNQKIPLIETHEHATLFYDYLREASKWGPKRGPMGAFVPRDVCNFDESPVALFGDQTKRSMNYVNVDNEVEGNICSKVKDGNPKLLITYSCNSHLNPLVKQSLRQRSVVIAIIPKGCTQYLQLLDTRACSNFKIHYFNAAEEFIEKNGPRNKLKLNAAQSRIICTRLTWEAWRRTLNSIVYHHFLTSLVCVVDWPGFTEIGYTWTDCSIVSPRTLHGYIYDPNKESQIQPNDHDDDIQNHIANEANLANQQHIQVMLKNGGKQLKLDELWKK